MDLYQLLGVEPNASPDEIKRAYRRHAIRYHPDRNKAEGATAQFQKLTKAYETLSDPKLRQAYDQQRDPTPPPLKTPQWSKVQPNNLKSSPKNPAGATKPQPQNHTARAEPEIQSTKTTAASQTKSRASSFFSKAWRKKTQASAAQAYEQRAQAEQQAAEAAAAAEKLKQQQQQRAAEQAEAAAAAELEQQRCQHCQATHRLLTRRHIYSSQGLGFTSKSRVNKGNFCPECLQHLLWQANLRTLLLGWWAWPKGPYYSLKALWANVWRDPQRQREHNALLTYQFLRKKLREGQSEMALALAYRAYFLSREPLFRQQMLDLIRRQTNLTTARLWLALAGKKLRQSLTSSLPAIGFVVLLWVSLYGVELDLDWFSRPQFKQQYQGENYVLGEQAIVHLAPSPTSPALKLLLAYEALFSPQGKIEQGFLEIEMADKRLGYVDVQQVGLGNGQRARSYDCHAALMAATPGQVIQHRSSGSNSLSLTNPYTSDLLLRLSQNQQVMYQVLLAPGQKVRLDRIANGQFQVELEQGQHFNLACGIFMRPIAQLQLPNQLEFNDKRVNGYLLPVHQELKLPKAW